MCGAQILDIAAILLLGGRQLVLHDGAVGPTLHRSYGMVHILQEVRVNEH